MDIKSSKVLIATEIITLQEYAWLEYPVDEHVACLPQAMLRWWSVNLMHIFQEMSALLNSIVSHLTPIYSGYVNEPLLEINLSVYLLQWGSCNILPVYYQSAQCSLDLFYGPVTFHVWWLIHFSVLTST